MNTVKSLGLLGLAVSGLFAAQAFATPMVPPCPSGFKGSPVCIATTGFHGHEPSLYDKLDGSAATGNSQSIFSTGPGVDPYTQQVNPSNVWTTEGTGGGDNTVQFTLTGTTTGLTFGIYDPYDTNQKIQLFGGATDLKGYETSLNWFNSSHTFTVNQMNSSGTVLSSQSGLTLGSNNFFGYYLTNYGNTWYSNPLSNDGYTHMVAFAGVGTGASSGSSFVPLTNGYFSVGEYIQAWEDGTNSGADWDYQDFVVMVESVHPVPEPAELGMFGLGLLLIGGFVTLRRRRSSMNA